MNQQSKHFVRIHDDVYLVAGMLAALHRTSRQEFINKVFLLGVTVLLDDRFTTETTRQERVTLVEFQRERIVEAVAAFADLRRKLRLYNDDRSPDEEAGNSTGEPEPDDEPT